jgi:CHAT domain-containing protein
MNSGKPSAAIRTFHQLVASPLPVSDAETTPLMTAFHRQVAAGRSVAEALSSAQERVRGDGDARTEAAVAGFVCIGSGFEPAPLHGAPPMP